MNIQKILLLGGSGFLGTYVTNRLSELGIQVTIPTRRRDRTKALIMLPGVDMVQADLRSVESLANLARGHDAVINLIGILHSRDVQLPYSRDFGEAHVETPRRLVEACRMAGVRRLVHVSALGADPKGPSEYLASKGEGEGIIAAAAQDLDVTIFRPSVIFGRGDSFLSTFAGLLRKFPILPLGMGRARFQPVFAADVADAIVGALADKRSFGQSYDLCGPKAYTLRELVDYTAELVGSRTRVISLCDTLAYVQAGLLWLMPKPLMSPDNLRSMQVDSVCQSGCNVPVGWKPTALESIAPAYLVNETLKERHRDRRHQAGR